jgi:hypothetical protein
VRYPAPLPCGLRWDAADGRLEVHLPSAPAARLITFDERA